MAHTFAIITTGDTVTLNVAGQGEAVFTVTNSTSRPARGLARVKALGETKQEWLTIKGEGERDFAANGTEQYAVTFAPTVNAAPGKYTFRLDVVSAMNPDEDFTEGPVVTAEVRTSPPPPKSKSWLIPAALVALLLIAVVVSLFVWLRSKGKDAPDPNPIPITTPTVSPTIAPTVSPTLSTTTSPSPSPPTTQSVYLQAASGNYIVATSGGGGLTNNYAVTVGPWDSFTLIDLNGDDLVDGDSINLKTVNNYYLGGQNGSGYLWANSQTAGAWETFTISKVGGSGIIKDGDSVALRASNGQYLRDVNPPTIMSNTIGAQETFTLHIIP